MLKDRWRVRRNRRPLVNFLSEEVRLIGKQNFGPLYLAQIKYQGRHLLRGRASSVTKAVEKITEGSCLVHDAVKNLFLIWLEREARYLSLPILEIFKLWACSVTGNLLAPITNRACILVEFLDLAARDFQTFAMIPNQVSMDNKSYLKVRFNLPFMANFAFNHHPSLRMPTNTEHIAFARFGAPNIRLRVFQ